MAAARCSQTRSRRPAHLNARDTTLAIVSTAPQPEIEAFKRRMDWAMPWYTVVGDGFQKACRTQEYFALDVFLRDEDRVFLTYETRGRGVESLGSVWSFLDLTPFGRQEDWEDSPQGRPQTQPYSWWRSTTSTNRARRRLSATRSRAAARTRQHGAADLLEPTDQARPPPARAQVVDGERDNLHRTHHVEHDDHARHRQRRGQHGGIEAQELGEQRAEEHGELRVREAVDEPAPARPPDDGRRRALPRHRERRVVPGRRGVRPRDERADAEPDQEQRPDGAQGVVGEIVGGHERPIRRRRPTRPTRARRASCRRCSRTRRGDRATPRPAAAARTPDRGAA